MLYCLPERVPISQFGRRPETSGDLRTLPSVGHRIQSQGSHRILERPLIGTFLQGEPPFYRQDIPRTCSVPALLRILHPFLDFLDGCLAHSRMTLLKSQQLMVSLDPASHFRWWVGLY